MADRSWVTSGLDPAAIDALLRSMPASELWSLLLEVMHRRAGERSLSDLTSQWLRDGFTTLSPADQRTLNVIDGELLAAAEAFEAVELSPLAPLGTCSVMAPASQNKIVSALRGTEVVADPTNVLALECARRLRRDPRQTVRLATCHRCVRAQPFPKQPGFAPHFRIFCLATAGSERADHGLTVDALAEHLATHLAALDRLEQHGFAFRGRRVCVLATPERVHLADRLVAVLRGVRVERSTLEHRYYDGIRFMIHAAPDGGDRVKARLGDRVDLPLIDGGAFDWVGRLASNRKLAFVASGMGTQLIAAMFRVRRE